MRKTIFIMVRFPFLFFLLAKICQQKKRASPVFLLETYFTLQNSTSIISMLCQKLQVLVETINRDVLAQHPDFDVMRVGVGC